MHLLYGHVVAPKALVASSLRMKPDHLFLAELTGDEAWHCIEMQNTGTGGTVCTAHANDAEAGFARVCGLIKQSPIGIGLDYSYIERLVRTTFDVVVYMENTYIEGSALRTRTQAGLAQWPASTSCLGERHVVESLVIDSGHDGRVFCDRAVRRGCAVSAPDSRSLRGLVLGHAVGGPQTTLERPADAVRALVVVCDGRPDVPASRHHADGHFHALEAQDLAAR
ncbi:Conjugal transfer protein [Pseudomonas savastanoi pv. glycinea]|nr:Conjugal transfer protein [Pseudomonas savastanoi pv. glycinea]